MYRNILHFLNPFSIGLKVKTLWNGIFGLAACGFLAACASSAPTLGSASTAVEVRSELPTPDPMQAARLSQVYIMGPFDSISVSVLRSEDMTRKGLIDAAGNFSLPLIGQIAAAGKTPQEFEQLVADKLRGSYFTDPQVTVTVLEISERTVTVDGAVKQPGVYPINGRSTLQQTVALARGPNEFAELKEVVVFRRIDGQNMAALFDMQAIRSGQAADPAIYPEDIVVVGANEGRRRFLDIVQVLPVLGVFSPVLTR